MAELDFLQHHPPEEQLTSFSPNENTGTRSALQEQIEDR